jgi:hypothetical protein
MRRAANGLATRSAGGAGIGGNWRLIFEVLGSEPLMVVSAIIGEFELN